MKDVHICPILMRTVIWTDGECTEKCDEEACPIQVLMTDSAKTEKVVDGEIG